MGAFRRGGIAATITTNRRGGGFLSLGPWERLDDPEQRARDVFTPIVRGTFVIGAAGLLVFVPFIAENKAGAAALSIGLMLSAGLAWRYIRRQQARRGAIVIVAAFWIVQTVLVTLSNGNLLGSGYLFTTLLAGLALGARAAWIVGGLGIAVLAATLAMHASGTVLPMTFPSRYPARAAYAIAALTAAMWALQVFMRRMEGAFGTAAHELAERKRTEQEVQRRAEDFEEAQRLAQSGSWEYDVATGVHRWSLQHFII
ncbi:MAG TPA: hypothetical protein VGO53_08025, partial [Steroidobacteraceae bacterium]|nr:hypothetical protein [Steroidobacteraceae bacterium]